MLEGGLRGHRQAVGRAVRREPPAVLFKQVQLPLAVSEADVTLNRHCAA